MPGSAAHTPLPSWQQFDCPRKTWPDADRAEIGAISRQTSVHLPPFSHGGYRATSTTTTVTSS